jgi:vacuolar-type H+-ATPase subunit H
MFEFQTILLITGGLSGVILSYIRSNNARVEREIELIKQEARNECKELRHECQEIRLNFVSEKHLKSQILTLGKSIDSMDKRITEKLDSIKENIDLRLNIIR